MAFDDNTALSQRDDALAKLATLRQAYEPALERVQEFKKNFGVRERSDGSIVVDYEKFAEAIGVDGALELRAIIDEKYKIRGAPGEKPRMRMAASNE
jgi:hypothetical protein